MYLDSCLCRLLDFSSISSNSMTMTDEFVVAESHRDPFTNDFDDGSIGPGRISAMSVEDDGTSFILSQSFGGSTVTELSSVFSMSEDDFDKMASRHARFLFDEIDCMLYEHQTNGPAYLVKECHEWGTEFPHLRVLGHQVIERQEEGFHLYPTMNSAPNGMDDISRTLESKDLLVHGKHFDLMQLSTGVGSLGLSHPEGAMPLEEILAENGTIEEILAIDYKTGEDECQKLGSNKQSNGRPPITPFNCVKDNIISTLFNHILKEMVPVTKPLLERLLENAGNKGTPEELPCGESTDDLELSLLSSRYSDKNSRSSSFGASVLSAVPEDTPLGGLLTIRSKTLLNRERTLGLLDGIAENLHGQTPISGIRLNPVIFGGSHLSERRSSLNRIKLSPLENNRLQSLVPPGEVDHAVNANLDGLRGHRFATLTSQPSLTPTPKLPPLQNQRAIMSANVPNTNINRSMQASRRGSQRAISAIHEKDVKVPFREKDKTSSLTLDFRPSTSQTLYNSEKRNDTPQSVSRQSAALVPLSIAHRPSTALSGKTATPPNLLLSGSGITPRKTEKLEPSGNETNQVLGGHLDLSRDGSGPLEDIMQVATRWNPMYSQLTRGKIYKNLQGGSTPPSVHSRLLQLRQAQHKTSVS